MVNMGKPIKKFKCPVAGSISSCQLNTKYPCPHVGEHFERIAMEGKKKGESLCLCNCGDINKGLAACTQIICLPDGTRGIIK